MPTFKNYSISTLIGEGGMAKVYLATHNTLGHKVAIKVLNKEYVFNSNIRSRFTEEAKKMVRMNHPNVVKVTDLIAEENTIAIVMEYVNGKTLKQILEEKKLNDKEIEIYFKQMVNALEYVHSQGLIHRDVKPSNFILSIDGHLKLTDFGISKSLDTENIENTQTATTVSLGTPMYMSPEQVRSTKDVTFLTDIYSLGVVLWEMVSGKKPFGGNTLSTFDLQIKIVQENLPLSKTFWDKVIQKATQKEETKRFQSAEEFLLALDNKFYSEIDLPKQKLKQEKQNRNRYFNFKTISIFIGILLFIGILIFNLSKDYNRDVSVASIPDKEKTEIVVPTEKADKQVSKKIETDRIEPKQIPKEKTNNETPPKVIKVEPIIETNNLKIGQKYQGGIIFYLDNSGVHGKVCSERDLGEFDWYSAMEECQNLNLNGYSDWYLPSENDLKLLYNQRKSGLHVYYWTSSEDVSGDGALTVYFSNGGYSSAQFKVNTSRVRAVRDF